MQSNSAAQPEVQNVFSELLALAPEPSAEPVLTPTNINILIGAEGMFALGDILGEGTYGKVREGVNLQTMEVVAAKSLDKRLIKRQRNGLENVKREISVHKRLGKHPTIVGLIEVINRVEKSKIHLVMEYMHCGTVQELLDRAPLGRLPYCQARECFRGLLQALQYCHTLGVVHKDVKPGNLMLAANGTVRLGDFGCAEVLDQYKAEDTCSRTLGSPAFQSPEIATGLESFSGIKVDIWAAGVTLYQIVTGKIPFDADNLCDLFETISRADVEIPEELGSELADLIRAILNPQQDGRLDLEAIQRHRWMSMDLPDDQRVPYRQRKPRILDMLDQVDATVTNLATGASAS